MNKNKILSEDRYQRQNAKILNTEMAYIDTRAGEPIVFLHGNPTYSYLWRNVIPHVEKTGRCLAPDLVGMGDSGKSTDNAYRFIDQSRYLDAWFDALGLTKGVTLVLHDWGSALGFYWAYRHPERLRAIVYMEAIVETLLWEDEWPGNRREIFERLRSSAGEEMILEKNLFIEMVLPSRILRDLRNEEMDAYRRPYLEPGEGRLPMLIWPRELPINGQPPDVVDIVENYSKWMSENKIPKLFINADPGGILCGRHRQFCRTWPNQKEITVSGIHFIPEDSPAEIGKAIEAFLASRAG